jgi:hypothetical protein
LGLWIRNRIGKPDLDPGRQNDPLKQRKVKKYDKATKTVVCVVSPLSSVPDPDPIFQFDAGQDQEPDPEPRLHNSLFGKSDVY